MPLKYNLTFALLMLLGAWDAGEDCSSWARDLNDEHKIAILLLNPNTMVWDDCIVPLDTEDARGLPGRIVLE